MWKRLLYPLATASVLLNLACSGGPEESRQDPASGAGDQTMAESAGTATADAGPVVLFLGDSITAGLGVDPELAFPALLQHRADSLGIKMEVINAGSSGETSAGGLRRLSWLLRRPIDVLALELGGNDGLRGVDLSSTRQNLQGIVDGARAANPELSVLISGMMMPPNMGQDYAESFRSMYPELATANGAVLIPFLLDGVGGVDSLMQADRIHPNARGHRRVANLVWPYLLQALEAVPERP
jgi:acyl-CoA thioesterase I